MDLENPDWRLSHLYKIVTKDGQLINLHPNSVQQLINKCRRRRKMILKARQFGVTTQEVIKQLDFVCFNENVTACILAHERDALEKIFNIVRIAYDNMPSDVRPRVDRGGGSKYELRFPKKNTKIYVDLEVRGGTNHWLHVSEAHFADSARIKATKETVPLNGIITEESTANGMSGDFYVNWIDRNYRSAKLFYPWFIFREYAIQNHSLKNTELTPDELDLINRVNLEYGIKLTLDQIAFRRQKQSDLKELFIQEYPEDDVTCFLASGNAAVDLRTVKRLMDELPSPLIADETFEKYIEKETKKSYVIGADTAEGVGRDYSVATVYEVETLRQCAQIRHNRWKPTTFALELVKLAKQYTSGERAPLMAVERNNHGHTVLSELYEHLHYANLYSFKNDDEYLGWQTDKITRPIMIDGFIDGLECETVQINSMDTLHECLTLIDNKGKIEAEDGEHDDCIIASSIALQVCIAERKGLGQLENIGSKILI